MAPAQVSNGPKMFSNAVAKSPPKAQKPLPVKAKCEFAQMDIGWRSARRFWQQRQFRIGASWRERKGFASAACRGRSILPSTARRRSRNAVFVRNHTKRASIKKKIKKQIRLHQQPRRLWAYRVNQQDQVSRTGTRRELASLWLAKLAAMRQLESSAKVIQGHQSQMINSIKLFNIEKMTLSEKQKYLLVGEESLIRLS